MCATESHVQTRQKGTHETFLCAVAISALKTEMLAAARLIHRIPKATGSPILGGLLSSARRGRWNRCRNKSTEASVPQLSGVSTNEEAVCVQWADGSSSRYHHIWLRDHCGCEKCYNYLTNQKEFNIMDVPLDINPVNLAINEQQDLSIKWPDGHVTVFDAAWLGRHSYGAHQSLREKKQELFLWDRKGIETNTPEPFNFAKVLEDDNEAFKLSQSIVKHGFAFVQETPTELKAVEEVAVRLGGFPLETHYGKLWNFSNEALDHADTAYTASYLRGHIDNTYFSQPAGIQMLHCVGHTGSGGMNLLVDAFHAAERLRREDKGLFDFLTSTVVPFHYKDAVIHLEANGPIIELDPFDGTISQIRFNTYDTACLDCLKYEDVPRFYKALKAYTSITCDPESQYWLKLTPGKLLLMANWRVLHGRSSFTGKRTMQGCYISKDYFFGRYRENALKFNK